jgi:hypothetical protein
MGEATFTFGVNDASNKPCAMAARIRSRRIIPRKLSPAMNGSCSTPHDAGQTQPEAQTCPTT